MSLPALCIQRPVATSLLALGLTLAGWVGFWRLPVAPLPQVDFPTIAVTAELPGANPEVMAATVAAPLERALGRIAGITEMTSASSLGVSQITLQFDLARDIDGAARDVQAAINASASLLPSAMPNRPSYRKVNPADAPILILALTSKLYDRGRMYDAAATILAQKLSQLPGIGQVTVGGGSLPAVRVELNPWALAKYGITLEDVRTAIAAGNVMRPKGVLEAGGRHWQIQANDQARTAAEYRDFVVAYRNGAPVRIADLGDAVTGVEDMRTVGLRNGQPAVLLMLRKQPGANVIATVARVKALLPQLRAMLPGAVDLQVSVDRSQSIIASIAEVERSLAIAVALVIGVALLFLRRLRSALIPVVAVPVSLLGACGVMYLCGFSLDNLSLMALTVATGFVVDDAVVVLENISRYLEQGYKPLTAALRGAREVGFTVLAMSLALIAVFLPILLMGGIVGRLFQEFAVTLSAAVLTSLLVSLTLTPMLCARWLQPAAAKPARAAGRLAGGYRHSLAWTLRHPTLMLALLVVGIGLSAYLYAVIPKGFFPTQDTGRLTANIQADQSISFQAISRKLRDFAELLLDDPAIDSVSGFAGGGRVNTGQLFVVLKPPDQRGQGLDEILPRLHQKLAGEAGASLFLQPIQDLRIGGRASAALFEYALQAEDLAQLREWTPKIVAALKNLPQLSDVNSNQQDRGRQITLTVDRNKAARLGVSQAAIDAALYDAFGQRPVAVIYQPLNQYRVVLELAPPYRQDPSLLRRLYVNAAPVPGQAAAPIPLAALASFAPTNTPLTVNHQDQFATSTIAFNLKPGVSLSEATRLITKTLRELGAPETLHGSFQGAAKAFQQALQDQPWLILAALLAIYIVLGVLYESYLQPLTILSTLPSAGVGALLALMACGAELSLIALIGVLLLLGLVMKNAIMMVDFALHAERQQGLAAREAIFQASLLRFRPIMMTSLAALLGALPLALATGYGAELRRPLGIAIVGGLLASQLLTLYTTPALYLCLARLAKRGQNRLGLAPSEPSSLSD